MRGRRGAQRGVPGEPDERHDSGMSRAKPIRILLVDDDANVRLTMTRWCSYQSDIEVVGEAANGEDGVALAKRVPADVIVMDYQMPKLSGLAAAKRLRAAGIDTPIVFLSAQDKVADRIAGLGAVAFHSKHGAAATETLDLIRSMAGGNNGRRGRGGKGRGAKK